MQLSLLLLSGLSSLGGLLCLYLLPRVKATFIKAGLHGRDLNKPKTSSSSAQVPESTGLVTGCVFLVLLVLQIPLAFPLSWPETSSSFQPDFPHHEFAQVLACTLSIASMLLMGFADDVLDLKWRHKLVLPVLASLPLLAVYHVTTQSTTVSLPLFLRPIVGTHCVNLGKLYHLYMLTLAVFSTHAINIYAGVNGLETGQSLVIALSVAAFNFKELHGPLSHYHTFSLYFLTPYIWTTSALFYHNAYPSAVFVGDTFCLFSGMTLASVAILGHFSKTLLLFFMPQIFNFLYSTPQLFRLLPCPRHRIPKYREDTDDLEASTAQCKEAGVKPLGRLILRLFHTFRLVDWRQYDKDGETYYEFNNLTLINLALLKLGPKHERTLTNALLLLQLFCSVLAFVIRYPLAYLFYGDVVA